MNYKITTQYSRGEETMIAEFCVPSDATIFLTKKISYDEQQAKKKIYRLYDEAELVREFNSDGISVAYAQYAEGDFEFIKPISFLFNVTIQIKNAVERQKTANFNDPSDANLFIIGKCETDGTVNEIGRAHV